jgi:hypothetical protein
MLTLSRCAVSPSLSAKTAISPAISANASFEYSMTLLLRKNELLDRPAAQRAVPPVGKTWDGPAA